MASLLHAAECCILLIDPRRRHIDKFDQATQQTLVRRFGAIERAASAAAIPCHVALDGNASDLADLLAKPHGARPCVHNLDGRGTSWSDSGIATALTAEKRGCLVLCGFWLETVVTFMALPALASGFDVFLLMDAAPCLAEDAREPSSNRLVQAGVVPTTTHQLIAEWAEQGAEPALRSHLSQLIESR